jgi:hypothetical protein
MEEDSNKMRQHAVSYDEVVHNSANVTEHVMSGFMTNSYGMEAE